MNDNQDISSQIDALSGQGMHCEVLLRALLILLLDSGALDRAKVLASLSIIIGRWKEIAADETYPSPKSLDIATIHLNELLTAITPCSPPDII